ncbi:MAG: hypothetical protein CMN71_13715 [Sphingomonadaceae bacterium]|nr:hypothetical protein [Sphingomonadaceae bacterium]
MDKRPSIAWKRFQSELASDEELSAWDSSDLNIGVVCGPISGIMVLDIDSDEASAFVETLELPPTPAVTTARGKHLYFRYPAKGLRNATKIEGVPLDARGDGGYVVGAGSIHPDGTVYEWEITPQECDFAELPPEVLERLFSQKTPKKTAIATRGSTVRVESEFVEAGKFATYLNVHLNEVMEALRETQEGGRNEALNRGAFSIACDVSAIGCEWEALANQLRNVALEVGLGPKEVDATIQSAWEAGSVSPTQWIRVANDWIYIAQRDRFLSKQKGRLLKRDAFSVLFNHVPFPKGLGGKLGIGNNCGLARFLTGADLIDKVVDMVFEPTRPAPLFEEAGQLYFNSYEAPSVVPVEGDPQPFLEFLEYLVPDETERSHLLGMIAWTSRNPGGKLDHALLLRSKAHGVGKTTLINIWRGLLGTGNTRKTNSEEMAGNFQSFIAGTLLVVVEEVNLGKGHREYNRLKDLITGETAVVNEKFVPTYEARNFANFVFLSNLENPLMIAAEDRRFFVLDSPAEKRDREYWNTFHRWLEDNLGVIKHFIDAFDLENFNPHAAPPMTLAKEQLIASSRPPIVRELKHLIENAAWPFSRDVVTLDEVKAALAEEGIRPSLNDLRKAMTAAGCVSLSQGRVPGRWIYFAGSQPRYVEGQARASLWACRKTDLWSAVRPTDRSLEYAREIGLLSEIEENSPNFAILSNMVDEGIALPKPEFVR